MNSIRIVVALLLCNVCLLDCILLNPYFDAWSLLRSRVSGTINRPISKDDSKIVSKSDLRNDYNRTVWIITTAAMPWLTGTAVNPLLRAVYLAKTRPKGKIHLLVPWIPPKDQMVYDVFRFDSQCLTFCRLCSPMVNCFKPLLSS